MCVLAMVLCMKNASNASAVVSTSLTKIISFWDEIGRTHILHFEAYRILVKPETEMVQKRRRRQCRL